ncbi:MAG: hypothetical protein JW928_05815, partial [Candidatus Aureabacteria bacterium]|nr:hypothetical protein [Candidatus Auribacterota bacterium]
QREEQVKLKDYTMKRETVRPLDASLFPSTEIFHYWNFDQSQELLLYDVFTRDLPFESSEETQSVDIGISGLGLSFATNTRLRLSNKAQGMHLPFGISFAFLVKSQGEFSQILHVSCDESGDSFSIYLCNDNLIVKAGDREFQTGLIVMENAWYNISAVSDPAKKRLVLYRDEDVLLSMEKDIRIYGDYTVLFGLQSDKLPGFEGTLDEVRLTHSQRWTLKIHLLPPRRGLVAIAQGDTTSERSIQLFIASDNASECIISEKNNFRGADWQKISDPVSFTLSPSEGEKTLYIKLRNDLKMESDIFKKKIHLIQYRPVAEILSPTDNSYIPLLR